MILWREQIKIAKTKFLFNARGRTETLANLTDETGRRFFYKKLRLVMKYCFDLSKKDFY